MIGIVKGLGDNFTVNSATCADPNFWSTNSACQSMFPAPSDATGPSQLAQCVDAANQTTASIDQQAQLIAASWNPQAAFAPDQIRAIVSMVLTVIQQAQNAVDNAQAQPNANQSDLNNATDDLTRHGAQAIDYLTAANQADASGSAVVNAPRIKQWVLNALDSGSNAMVAAYTVSCMTPSWVGDLAAFDAAVGVLASAVIAIAGLALAAVQTAGHIVVNATEGITTLATGTFHFLEWLSKWWPALGGAIILIGGFIAYKKVKRFRGFIVGAHEE